MQHSSKIATHNIDWTVMRQFIFTVILTGSTLAQHSWVDSQTPDSAKTTIGMGGRKLSLVFSDEFEDSNRMFGDGSDTRWTAEDRPGTTNAALHYYNSSHVKTSNGKLVIETTRQNTVYTEHDPNGWLQTFERNYQSGMVSTWNKFCFTSGLIEISFQLPGDAKRGGLWPAFWMLGNLARPSYLKSTNGVWPWSNDQCGVSEESRINRDAQEMNTCVAGVGRGSPEIDILEAQPGNFKLEYTNVDFVDGSKRNLTIERPMISSSLQVAPGVANSKRPISPSFPEQGAWYKEFYPMGGPAYGDMENTDIPRMLNNYWYGQLINENGSWQDGISVNWQHNVNFYSEQNVMRTEWQVGEDDGYVRWYFGDELIYEVTADALNNKPGAKDALAQIPYEAMYLILNTDVSPRWGWDGCDPSDPCMQANPGLCVDGELTCRDCSDPKCLVCPHQTGWLKDFCDDIQPSRPAQYEIEYVRVYQDKNDPTHHVGCSPPDYPTKEIIDNNKERYIFDPFVQEEPLQPVRHGGGQCVVDADCGAYYTTQFRIEGALPFPNRDSACVSGVCQCPEYSWTGPNCMSPCMGEYRVCLPHSASSASSRPLVILCVVFSLLSVFV